MFEVTLVEDHDVQPMGSLLVLVPRGLESLKVIDKLYTNIVGQKPYFVLFNSLNLRWCGTLTTDVDVWRSRKGMKAIDIHTSNSFVHLLPWQPDSESVWKSISFNTLGFYHTDIHHICLHISNTFFNKVGIDINLYNTLLGATSVPTDVEDILRSTFSSLFTFSVENYNE